MGTRPWGHSALLHPAHRQGCLLPPAQKRKIEVLLFSKSLIMSPWDPRSHQAPRTELTSCTIKPPCLLPPSMARPASSPSRLPGASPLCVLPCESLRSGCISWRRSGARSCFGVNLKIFLIGKGLHMNQYSCSQDTVIGKHGCSRN